jgi:hypothetical protein
MPGEAGLIRASPRSDASFGALYLNVYTIVALVCLGLSYYFGIGVLMG